APQRLAERWHAQPRVFWIDRREPHALGAVADQAGGAGGQHERDAADHDERVPPPDGFYEERERGRGQEGASVADRLRPAGDRRELGAAAVIEKARIRSAATTAGATRWTHEKT